MNSFQRVWPMWLAILMCLGVLVADLTLYRPARERLQRAAQGAKAVGLSLDPSERPIVAPTSVQEFVLTNSMPEGEAASAVQSGLLTASLTEEATTLAGRCGLTVTGTEPGLAAQQGSAVVVRAVLRARGTYSELLHFLDLLATGPELFTVDYVQVNSNPGSSEVIIEMSITRHVLKRTKQAKP